MLKIRLTRTGKTNQESFRIVVAEKSRAVKGKFLELVGHYTPAQKPKLFDVKKERVEYWMSKGAQPSSTVAALLKSHGFANMESFIEVRSSKTSKKAQAEAGAAGGAAPAKTA